MAADLIKDEGSLQAVGLLDVRQLASRKGIGLAKAATLAAAFELGARAVSEPTKNLTMGDPQTVFDFLLPYTKWVQQEKLFVLMLDTKMNLLGWKEVASGILNESLAHPREILRPVLLHNAYGFILAHNHPSGDPRPSVEDYELTRTIREAAALLEVSLLDHVIIGSYGGGWSTPFYSFRREKKLVKDAELFFEYGNENSPREQHT